jgi:N-acetylneuraminate synthase
MKPAKVIAEIGCNHKGDMEIAFELIKVASMYAKADAVKFQKRNNKELLSEDEYHSPHPNPVNSYGETYGEHREFLEFDVEQHKDLIACCKEFDMEYSTSVWDVTSAREMAPFANWLKVPSACNLNKPLLEVLCKEFPGKIHLSTGMTTKDEVKKIVDYFVQNDRNQDLILYNCTSGYPVPFEDICLLDIVDMIETYDETVDAIGFSGHHLGIAADIAAMTLGARYIERHYTLDRTWKGTDHAASLEPDGLRRLCRDVRNVSKALTRKSTEILDIEAPQKKKLKANQIRWD